MFSLQNVSTSSFENWMTYKGELAQLAFMYVVEESKGKLIVSYTPTLGGPIGPSRPERCASPPGNGAAHPCRMGHAPKAQQMDGCTPGGLQPFNQGISRCLSPKGLHRPGWLGPDWMGQCG